MLVLESIYEESHEPEALGICKILSISSTLFTIYLLDYILPEVSKLSKSLQAENLDLSIISSLVDATLHTLEDVLHSAAKWVLDLQEVKEEMYTNAGISFNSDDVAVFQGRVTVILLQIERKYPKPLHFTRYCHLFQFFLSKEDSKFFRKLYVWRRPSKIAI